MLDGGADRKRFNGIVRAEALNMKSTPTERRRGPKAEILPQLIVAMKADIASGQLSQDDLAVMPDKELEARYQRKRDRVRTARQKVLAELKK